jgi:acid phosphatase
MDAMVGYVTPHNVGRVLGSIFVNKLIERYVLTLVKALSQISFINTLARFSDTSEEAQSLYLEFGHDTTIMAAMAAMCLNRYVPLPIELDFISYIYLQG